MNILQCLECYVKCRVVNKQKVSIDYFFVYHSIDTCCNYVYTSLHA